MEPPAQHIAYLCLGSNIDPEENLRKAIRLLREHTRVLEISKCWETEAVGSSKTQNNWPNFLNLGMCVETPLAYEALKEQVLRPIEKTLGRVRGEDKFAPRTMDLDITVFDGQVVDPELWRRLYLALIFGEMLPQLRNPETGETLSQTAERIKKGKLAIQHANI